MSKEVEDIINSYNNTLNSITEPTEISFEHKLEQISFPTIRNPLIENMEDNYASSFHNRLKEWISEFDDSLDQAHEVGVRLVSFGQTVVFHLEGMGYYNPSLISFHGHTEDGNPVELIQHVSQISLLLTKLQRKDPSSPKKPIGFASEVSQDENPEK